MAPRSNNPHLLAKLHFLRAKALSQLSVDTQSESYVAYALGDLQRARDCFDGSKAQTIEQLQIDAQIESLQAKMSSFKRQHQDVKFGRIQKRSSFMGGFEYTH